MSRLYTLAFVFLAACVNSGDETVLILENQPPTAGCSVDAEEGGAFISTGLIDVDTIDGYIFTPIVKNYADANDADPQRGIAFVSGARVDIHFADPELEAAYEDSDLTRFEVPISGSIDPGGGVTSFRFTIVPGLLINEQEIADPLRDRVVLLVDVHIVGTINNGFFETQTFRYPVEICSGCLINDVGLCSAWPEDTAFPNQGGGCNVAQDQVVDCCDPGDGTLVCPAVGTMTAFQ